MVRPASQCAFRLVASGPEDGRNSWTAGGASAIRRKETNESLGQLGVGRAAALPPARAAHVVWCALAMPRCCCRCLVLLLLVAVAAGFLAPPAEAGKRPFADIVNAAAHRHGVDPSLVHAVIAVESGYRANAQSPAGAQGLMQLMPGTQRQLGVSDAFDPQQNVDAGVAYLRRLTDEFGTVLALAAYNAGPGAVRRYNGIPPYRETRAYVQAVLRRARPAADAQEAPEEQASSGDRAHAAAEAEVAEGDAAGRRLQDDPQGADGAGREPHALGEALDLDGRAGTVGPLHVRPPARRRATSAWTCCSAGRRRRRIRQKHAGAAPPGARLRSRTAADDASGAEPTLGERPGMVEEPRLVDQPRYPT